MATGMDVFFITLVITGSTKIIQGSITETVRFQFYVCSNRLGTDGTFDNKLNLNSFSHLNDSTGLNWSNIRAKCIIC